jgi:ATP-dependent exoDNAse (exonuclease V) alpha subunit
MRDITEAEAMACGVERIEISPREIDGIGFKTADRIAINLGYANDAPPRLDAGLIFALETLQEEGHTAYPRGELVDYSAALLETSAELLEARLDALLKEKSIVQQPSVGAPLDGARWRPQGTPLQFSGVDFLFHLRAIIKQ